MKKENGFTLIELLAVIVILAIIALIATPIVLNLINEARKGAAKDSAYGVKKAAELYYSTELLGNEGTFNTIKFTCDGKECKSNDEKVLNIEGTVPDSNSTVVIDGEGKVTYPNNLKFGNYTVRYNEENKKFEVVSGGSNTSNPTPIPEPKAIAEMSQNGETYLGIVYLDPTDKNASCNSTLASQNVNTYIVDNVEYTTPTGKDSGCMKWYLYKEVGNNYKAILDHNTTALVQWNTTDTTIPLESSNLQSLINDLKTSWVTDDSFVTDVGIITGQEVADLTNNTTWTNGGAWYYLDSNSQTQVTSDENKSAYAWLYDNTYDCEVYGCNVKDNNEYTNISNNLNSNIFAYWVDAPYDTSVNDRYVWFIWNWGSLEYWYPSDTSVGFRPVITIPKSIIQ